MNHTHIAFRLPKRVLKFKHLEAQTPKYLILRALPSVFQAFLSTVKRDTEKTNNQISEKLGFFESEY